MTLRKHILQNNTCNVVLSPVSVQLVLGLVAAGSESETLKQLLSFLKAESTDELNSLASHLVNHVFTGGSPSGGPILSLANGVWIDKSLSFKPFFSKIVDDVYKAAYDVLDFKNKANEAADKVNAWIKKETNGLFKDIVPRDQFDDETTKIVFANAIYFKGLWANKFDMLNTRKYDFHLLDDSSVHVPFMTSTITHYCISAFDGFKVLQLPYKHETDMRDISMYFFLPDAKDGLSTLVDKLASESGFLERHIPSVMERVGELRIPKFKMSFGFEASKALKELGVCAQCTVHFRKT
ncbi:serpin-ZX-like [Apium graveolens]|uniref:serpin-ZX-like n=1 Tax=Apium graveolens TaxID=4045 RepID=UPI003D7A48CB